MTLKVKKGSGDINIRIETNIFSKNKDKDKPKPKPKNGLGGGDGGASGLVESYSVRSPYEPEPSFLSEIKTAMSERNFYGMKFNPRPSIMPPAYNNWYDTHSRFQVEDMDDDDERLPQPPREMVDFVENEKYDIAENEFYEDVEATELNENIDEYEIPDAPSSPAPLPKLNTPVKTRGAKIQAKYIGEPVYFDKNGTYLFSASTKKERTFRDKLIQQREAIKNGERTAYSKTHYKLGLI